MLEISKWAFLEESVEPGLLFQLIACVIIFSFFKLAWIIHSFNGTRYNTLYWLAVPRTSVENSENCANYGKSGPQPSSYRFPRLP